MPTAEATRLVQRVDATLDQARGRFPVHADPSTGQWTWADDGAWSAGFWVGLLGLSARATGDDLYAEAAAVYSRRLAPRAQAPTVLRGFLFWYGAGLIAELGLPGGDGTTRAAVEAAYALAKDVDPASQLIPPGEEDEAL